MTLCSSPYCNLWHISKMVDDAEKCGSKLCQIPPPFTLFNCIDKHFTMFNNPLCARVAGSSSLPRSGVVSLRIGRESSVKNLKIRRQTYIIYNVREQIVSLKFNLLC